MKSVFGPFFLVALVTAVCAVAAHATVEAAPAPHADHEIDACAAAMAGAASGDADGYQRVSAACAVLYRQPACRNAWRALGSASPQGRIASLALPCRDAYCPLLAAPRPAACDPAVTSFDEPATWGLWAELHIRILVSELGEAGYGRMQRGASALRPVATRLDVPREPVRKSEAPRVFVRPAAPGRVQVLAYRRDRVVASETFGSGSGAEALESVAAALGPADPSGNVLILADRRVLYGDVAAVMDALVRAGYRNVSFAVEEAPDAPAP